MLLITGANGQLGLCLKDILGPQGAFYTDAADLDITNYAALDSFAAQHQLDGIVNCAAYTNVDKAEEEPLLAEQINALGPANLAKLAAKYNIPLVHVSTDYVFDGCAHTPLTEADSVSPLGVYGKTKRAGEEAVLKYAKTAVILRTAWLYSPYGKNFVKTMLNLGKTKEEVRVVADQIGTPTYAPHLAQAIVQILPQLKEPGVRLFHFTDEGVASWYDFAYYAISRAGLKARVLPIATREYPTKAVRPAFSVLDKLLVKKTFAITIDHWTKGVDECLKKLS